MPSKNGNLIFGKPKRRARVAMATGDNNCGKLALRRLLQRMHIPSIPPLLWADMTMELLADFTFAYPITLRTVRVLSLQKRAALRRWRTCLLPAARSFGRALIAFRSLHEEVRYRPEHSGAKECKAEFESVMSTQAE